MAKVLYDYCVEKPIMSKLSSKADITYAVKQFALNYAMDNMDVDITEVLAPAVIGTVADMFMKVVMA